MNKTQIVAIIFSCTPTFFTGCGGAQQEKQNQENASDTAKTATADSSTYKIYSLPAPMQIPSALKNLSTSYSAELLNPHSPNTSKYPTSFKKALNIGVYGVDLGYATTYDQKQTAIYYLSAIQSLASELNIVGGFESSAIKRFKDNQNNSDSLTVIVLSTFNAIHTYLEDNNKRDVGLLILSGSFIEGLYLSQAMAAKNKSSEITKLIGQQRQFLDNLLELLPQYSSEAEIGGLIKNLEGLKEAYDKIELVYADTKEPNTKTIQEVKASAEQLQKISEKIKSIRAEIVAG